MAERDVIYCPHQHKISGALNEGRRADAVTEMVVALRSGNTSAAAMQLIADFIDPKKKPTRRGKSYPKHWFEIGSGYDFLTSEGMTQEDAEAYLEKKFGYSKRTIAGARAFYRKAKIEYDLISAEG